MLYPPEEAAVAALKGSETLYIYCFGKRYWRVKYFEISKLFYPPEGGRYGVQLFLLMFYEFNKLVQKTVLGDSNTSGDRTFRYRTNVFICDWYLANLSDGMDRRAINTTQITYVSTCIHNQKLSLRVSNFEFTVVLHNRLRNRLFPSRFKFFVYTDTYILAYVQKKIVIGLKIRCQARELGFDF